MEILDETSPIPKKNPKVALVAKGMIRVLYTILGILFLIGLAVVILFFYIAI